MEVVSRYMGHNLSHVTVLSFISVSKWKVCVRFRANTHVQKNVIKDRNIFKSIFVLCDYH